MTATVHWSVALTALSSITHGERTLGTMTLLRRETIIGPTGEPVEIPLVSGNAFRSALRRTAEELFRDAVGYEGRLGYAAAATLRGGGRLAKTSGEPLTGRALHETRRLIPVLRVFGGAAAGSPIGGCLQVGKVLPHLAETAHLTDPTASTPAIRATQTETYTRTDQAAAANIDELCTEDTEKQDRTPPMLFRIETFPAGTRFSSWIRLERATDLEVAFTRDVLARYGDHAILGGRAAIGHGRVSLDLTDELVAGAKPDPKVSWRTFVDDHRSEILTALDRLT